MALESSTEVPPNFITSTVAASRASWMVWVPSGEIAFVLQQFGIEQCGSGRAPNRIVRQDCEFPVEQTTRTQPADDCTHALSTIDIEPRLRTTVCLVIDD